MSDIMNDDPFYPTSIDELIEFLEVHTKQLKKIRTQAKKQLKKHKVTVKSLNDGDTWDDVLVGCTPDGGLVHLYGDNGSLYFDDDLFIPNITQVAIRLLPTFCDKGFEIVSQGIPIIPNT